MDIRVKWKHDSKKLVFQTKKMSRQHSSTDSTPLNMTDEVPMTVLTFFVHPEAIPASRMLLGKTDPSAAVYYQGLRQGCYLSPIKLH